MKKTITIKPEHFDAAVKQNWHYKECFIAQCMIANNMDVDWINPLRFAEATGIRNLQSTFDRYFNLPGDESKPELVALRASLPISVEVEV